MTVEVKPAMKKVWFAYFTGLVFWLFLTYGALATYYAEGRTFAYSEDGATYTADFILYYNNGILARDCLTNKIDIYDAKLQNEYLQRLVPHVKLDKIFYSQYPPYLFVVMMPLPLLPMHVTWMIWEFLGLVGIVFSVRLLLSDTLKGKFTHAFTYIGVLASFPGWLCFRLAQVALMLYPALIGYWVALDRKRWFLAGVLGGFCLLKLQYAPIMFLAGLFLGGVRFFAGYSLMGLIYLSGTIGVLGIDNLLRYPQALKFGEISGQVTGVAPESQQNIRGQLVQWFHNDGSEIHAIVVVAWAVATLATAYLWWRYSREVRAAKMNEEQRRKRFMILASITMILQLVTSPHTHKQDYIFITVPAIYLMYSMVGDFPLGKPAMEGLKHPNLLMLLRYMIVGFPIFSWVFFQYGAVICPMLNMPEVVQPFFWWAVIVVVLVTVVALDRNRAGGNEFV